MRPPRSGIQREESTRHPPPTPDDGRVPVTYRQYCPVARASEILAERWSLLIVRNLLFGATTFSAIAGGVPTMSRSMLVKRLRELEAAGIIVRTPKANGQGSRLPADRRRRGSCR